MTTTTPAFSRRTLLVGMAAALCSPALLAGCSGEEAARAAPQARPPQATATPPPLRPAR